MPSAYKGTDSISYPDSDVSLKIYSICDIICLINNNLTRCKMRHEALMESYFQEKDVSKRNEILKRLLLDIPVNAKDFFLMAFKKERYLDMKLSAVRGYAAYATEGEVTTLMNKLLELLKKRSEKTPYNYTEYEPMRSVFLMPYLLEHYDYECFRVFHSQLEKQYDHMPNCFKGIFTLDEFGNACSLRKKDEVEKSWRDFWGR